MSSDPGPVGLQTHHAVIAAATRDTDLRTGETQPGGEGYRSP